MINYEGFNYEHHHLVTFLFYNNRVSPKIAIINLQYSNLLYSFRNVR